MYNIDCWLVYLVLLKFIIGFEFKRKINFEKENLVYYVEIELLKSYFL